jgi:hypothetical protein
MIPAYRNDAPLYKRRKNTCREKDSLYFSCILETNDRPIKFCISILTPPVHYVLLNKQQKVSGVVRCCEKCSCFLFIMQETPQVPIERYHGHIITVSRIKRCSFPHNVGLKYFRSFCAAYSLKKILVR